jgi:hypothetical protein
MHIFLCNHAHKKVHFDIPESWTWGTLLKSLGNQEKICQSFTYVSKNLRKSRIVDQSGTTSSLAKRDFTKLKTCRSEAEIPTRGAYMRQHSQRRASLDNRSIKV